MKQGEHIDSKKSASVLQFSWETIENMTLILASRVLADGKPDTLVCLQRGGLIPGVLLSHQLAVSQMICVPIRTTTSEKIYADKQAPVLIVPAQASQLAKKDVVLVDDIVGSGETMQTMRSVLGAFHPHRLRIAIYLVNLNHWEMAHGYPPEQEITYIGQSIRAWAAFPWERSACAAQGGKQINLR